MVFAFVFLLFAVTGTIVLVVYQENMGTSAKSTAGIANDFADYANRVIQQFRLTHSLVMEVGTGLQEIVNGNLTGVQNSTRLMLFDATDSLRTANSSMLEVIDAIDRDVDFTSIVSDIRWWIDKVVLASQSTPVWVSVFILICTIAAYFAIRRKRKASGCVACCTTTTAVLAWLTIFVVGATGVLLCSIAIAVSDVCQEPYSYLDKFTNDSTVLYFAKCEVPSAGPINPLIDEAYQNLDQATEPLRVLLAESASYSTEASNLQSNLTAIFVALNVSRDLLTCETIHGMAVSVVDYLCSPLVEQFFVSGLMRILLPFLVLLLAFSIAAALFCSNRAGDTNKKEEAAPLMAQKAEAPPPKKPVVAGAYRD